MLRMAFEYVQMVPKWLFHHQSSVYCVVVLVETALPIRLVAYLKMLPTKLFINTTIATGNIERRAIWFHSSYT